MQGLYYVLTIVAIFIVIRWYIANESSTTNGRTKGILAMKEPLSGNLRSDRRYTGSEPV